MMRSGARILLVSEDDDVAGPILALLRRAGHRAEILDGRSAAAALASEPPDLLVLDRDLDSGRHRAIADQLTRHPERDSFPLLVLGRKGTPAYPPPNWHEDACLVLARPPDPGLFEASVETLLRLAFYRAYRDLVHDLAQPVTAIHALSRTVAKIEVPEGPPRQAIDRLEREAERLMSLLEDFQRRGASRRY